MILINLLPAEFRKSEAATGRFSASPRLVKIGTLLFLGLTVIFYIQYLSNLRTLGTLQRQWPSINTEAQRVNLIKTEIEGGIKAEKEFLERYVGPAFPATKILSLISELLPNSMWLIELKITRKPQENSILLKGLARASRHHSSIQEIETYLRSFKEGLPPEARLVLTTSRVQRDKMELTLFTAFFQWN